MQLMGPACMVFPLLSNDEREKIITHLKMEMKELKKPGFSRSEESDHVFL